MSGSLMPSPLPKPLFPELPMSQSDESTELLREIRDSLRDIHDHMEKSEQQAEEFRKLAMHHQMSHRSLCIRVISAGGVIVAGLLYYLYRISI